MDQELLAQPGVRSYEMKSTRCDGSVRYDLNKKATLPGNDGSVGGIVGVIIDISEQKRMEEDILKAKNLQSLGTLAGGIAHDFNNLLMAIVGNLSLARMNTPDNGRLMDYLNEAERIAFLGKSLTQQLLTFSRGGEPGT
jgi:signal transduction histidine kinase